MATGAVQEDDSFVKQVQINQSAQQCFSKIIDVIDRNIYICKCRKEKRLFDYLDTRMKNKKTDDELVN